MNRTTSAMLASSLCFLILPAAANAAMMLEWSFDEPSQVVGPTDGVPILATLTNVSTGDEMLDGSTLSTLSIDNGSLLGSGNPYQFNFGAPGLSIFDIFDAIQLAPGESASFQFGQLTPQLNPVPAGTYNTTQGGAASASLTLGDVTYLESGGGVFSVTVVPEPSTALLLLGLSIAATRALHRTPVGSRKR